MNYLILCSIVLSAFFISNGDAIKCYVCNSAKNKTGCFNKQDGLIANKLNPNFLIDCDELGTGRNYTVCRKIDQDVPDANDIDPNARVIRECGTDNPANQHCYQKTGMGGRQFVCTCDQDGCNAGANIQMVLTTLFSFAVVALLGPKILL